MPHGLGGSISVIVFLWFILRSLTPGIVNPACPSWTRACPTPFVAGNRTDARPYSIRLAMVPPV